MEHVSRHFESVREELGDVVREVEAERARVAEAAKAQLAEPPKRPPSSSLAAGYAPTGNEYRDRKARLYLPYISLVSPLYLPCISPTSPVHLR